MASTGLAKGLASALGGGTASALACSALGFGIAPTIFSVLFATVGSFLYYARVWIQGYYFDKRCRVDADLTGKIAVVTGGTVGGLGYAAAEILHKMGATVVLTVRTAAKGEEAVAKLGGGERASYELVDVLSSASAATGAKALAKKLGRLDYLVLNAGVAKGDTAEMWMANQVGPFSFTELLTPLLVQTAKAHGDVRVVAVSSGAHKRASIDFEDPWAPTGPDGGMLGNAYGQSKLAQIMHMRELQKRLRAYKGCGGETAIRCLAMTPGFALTNLTPAVPAPLLPLLWLIARSSRVGAQPIKMACVDPDVPGGSYLSNCYVKPAEGKDGCANEPEQWAKLWALCEKCAAEAASGLIYTGKFP